jgi:apolipoprotein N-acyltransferase
MKKVSFLLVLLSAVVYAVPFLYSVYLWWLVFLFPIPLLYAARKDNVGFKQGFLWAFFSFLVHGSGGVSVVAHMAHEYWGWGVVLGLSIVIYQAICVGLIFWLFQLCIRFFMIHDVLSKLCINTVMLAFVIFWIDRGSFCIFGIIEGYPLMHPLILLTQHPPLLFLLPFVGKQLLTVVFLCFATSVVCFLLFKNKIACLYVLFAVSPWILSTMLYSPVVPEPSWVKDIVAFPHMTLCKTLYPVSMVKSMAQQMSTVLVEYPHAECIVMPESAFDSEVLSTVPDLLALWSEQYIGRPIHIVFGASRVCDGNYYNCGYWLYNGVLQECFDKRHTMVLSERIPDWLNCNAVRSMYRANGCCEVACGVSNRSAISMNGRVLVPYLCSELFFNDYSDGFEPILVLVNDSVFVESRCSGYIQDLLLMLACFKALMWQRDIVYVSYVYTVFIDKKGKICQLQQ